jgi:hypothetical protein
MKLNNYKGTKFDWAKFGPRLSMLHHAIPKKEFLFFYVLVLLFYRDRMGKGNDPHPTGTCELCD